MEDEISHLVGGDVDVANVLLIDTTVSNRMEQKILAIDPNKNVLSVNCPDVFPELDLRQGISVLIWLKPIELHQSPPLLREQVHSAIKCMEPHVRSFIMFYGQCGHAFRNVEKVLEDVSVPVSLLKGSNDILVDDCTGSLLGGTEEYRQFLLNQQGAYVLNTMWAANWKEFMQEIQMLRNPEDVSEIKEVFRYMDYRVVVGLDTGLVESSVFDRQLEEFADLFGMKTQRFPCTLGVVERCYQEAKGKLFLQD
jgi:hypothetical protein